MESSISWLEIFSLVSSLVSIILAGFAIWLSVKFYEMSSKNTDKLDKSSSNISSTTERLETLFEKLYSDTFSMVKDTMNDMRQHVWHSDQLPNNNEKYEKIKKELLGEFKKSISNKVDNSKLESLKGELEGLIDKAVSQSKEVSEESIHNSVIGAIRVLSHKGIKADLRAIEKETGLSESTVVDAIFVLRKLGTLSWEGEESSLGMNQNIWLVSE